MTSNFDASFDRANSELDSGARQDVTLLVAQADTGTRADPSASQPSEIIIALEPGPVAHLPAGTDIANIRQVGTDLQFIQPDGSVVTIPGGAVSGLVLFIGDVEIPADTVAVLFENAGINPAAGPDSGGPDGAHGNFDNLGLQSVGEGGDGNGGVSTLANTESFGFGDGVAGGGFDPNLAPVILGGGFLARVSEEAFGNADTLGDDTTNSASATGQVTVSDLGPLAFTFGVPAVALTSAGIPVVWTAIGGTLVGLAGSTTIVTATIDATGTYTLVLSGPLDHPVAGVEDILNITLPVTVTDSGNLSAETVITFTVEDDMPVVLGGSSATVEDEAVNSGNDEADGLSASVTGVSLNIDWGADNANTDAGGNGDRSVAFTDASVTLVGGHDAGLTSLGKAVSTLVLSTGELVGYTGGTAPTTTGDSQVVFFASLSDTANGTYDFTLVQPLDHAAGNGEDALSLTFGFTATDSDSDPASSTFTVSVADDVPEEVLRPTASGAVNIPIPNDGSTGGPASASITSSITVPTGGAITDVNVSINLTHTWMNDLNIFLIAPDGTEIELVDNTGGSGDPNGVVTLDDEAASSITNASAPFVGTWRPNIQALSDLDGHDAAGKWTLRIHDDSGLDSGTLFDWSLEITTGSGVASYSVDEDGLTDGNAGDSYRAGTDTSGEATAVSGALNIAWGADDANADTDGGATSGAGDRAVNFTDPANAVGNISINSGAIDPASLTSRGDQVTYTFDNDGGTLIATADADGANEREVFRVALSDQNDGSFKFALSDALDHPVVDGEDTLAFDFSYTVTDSDGDGYDSNFVVSINDDAPTIGLVNNTVAEDEAVNSGNDEADGYSAVAIGSLNISWGADNANSGLGGDGDRMVAFTDATVMSLDTYGSSLTSLGRAVSTAILSTGELVGYVTAALPTGIADAQVVFHVSLSDDAAGTYTFILKQPLDSLAGNGEDPVTLHFNYTATDSDGDTVDSAFAVEVQDDVPQFSAATQAISLDEEALSGNPGDSYATGDLDPNGALSQTGELYIAWGADSANGDVDGGMPSGEGDRAVLFSETINAGNNFTINGVAAGSAGLTSRGDTLSYEASTDGVTITALANDGSGPRTVFTLSLSDRGTGTYTFTLEDVLDHPTPNSEDDIVFSFAFTAIDSDGDKIKSSFSVTVNDDAPVTPDVAATTSENVDTGITLVNGVDFHYGADATLGALSIGTTSISDGPAGVTFGTPVVSLSGDTVSVVMGTAFDGLAAGETAVLHISYTATDGDGDPNSGEILLTVTGTNDAPVISIGSGDSAAKTLTETDATLTATDTLSVVDADLPDSVTPSVVSVATSGTTTGLGSDTAALASMLTVTPAPITADPGSANNLIWAFNSSSEAFDYLADGEHLTLTYTVRVTDGSGATDDQSVAITINGTNDVPVISIDSGDSAAKTLTETDATLTATDTLSVIDVDLSDNVTPSVVSVATSGTTTGLGSGTAALAAMLTVTPAPITADPGSANNLTWTFNSSGEAFDYLADGEHLTLTYTVRVTDGSGASDDQPVTITINGTNDAPVLSVAAAPGLAEVFSSDFSVNPDNNGSVEIFGAGNGGLITSERLQLTEDVQYSSGAITINPTTATEDFKAHFNLLAISTMPSEPADGVGFHYGSGIPTNGNPNWENSQTSSGLSIGFQGYWARIAVYVNGIELASAPLTAAQLFTGGFVPVDIVVANGLLTITHNGTAYITDLDIGAAGYNPPADSVFALGGRTGYFHAELTVDDLSIQSGTDTLTYTEGRSPTLLAGSVSVADVDDTNIESATVQITGNLATGEDVLGFTDMFNITGSYDAAAGTLTLTGADTLAHYQEAMASVTYANGSENPSTLERTITWTVNDGGADSAPVTTTIAVAAVDDAPVVDLDGAGGGTGFAAAFVEDGGPVAVVDTDMTVSDVDDTNLESAKVTITNPLDGAAESLSVDVAGTAITASYANGVLSLSGTDSVANYQAVLRTLSYNNASQDPDTTDRVITVVTNDGSRDSIAATSTVSVEGVNDAPQAVASTLNIAVVYDAGGDAAAVVDQLNDTGAFSFHATAVHYTDADSLAELSAYDVIIHAGDYNEGFSPEYWQALQAYVQADQGGVVTTGWMARSLSGDANFGAGQTAADYVTPVTEAYIPEWGGTGYFWWSYSDDDVLPNTGHPVTAGIPVLPTPDANQFFERTFQSDAGAQDWSNWGYGAIVTKETANEGNLVYLGGQYTESGSIEGNLRTGAWDQLLEQAVNWAGKGGSSVVVDEDTSVTFSGLSVRDVDANSDAIAVTLAVSHGTLTLAGATTGLTFSDADGSDGTLAFSGSQSDINAALTSLSYKGVQDFNGTDALTITANDGGATGTGGPQSGSDSVAIVVTAVNDAPEITVPSAGSISFTGGRADSGTGPFGDSVSVPGLTLGSDYTLEAWVRYDSATFSAHHTMIMEFGNDNPYFSLTPSGHLELNGAVGDPSVFPKGEWVHIAATVESGTGTLYVNGVAVASGTVTGGSAADLGIGYHYLDTGWVGLIDEVRVWNVARTPAQIAAVKDTQLTGNDAGLEAYWTFNEGAGTTTADLTGHGHSGTLTNAAAFDADGFAGSVANFATAEDNTVLITGVTISDVDAGAGDVMAILSVLHGSVAFGNLTGITVTAGANDSATVTVQGTVAAINAALTALNYSPDADYNGTDILSLQVSDLGNTGSGGAMVDTMEIPITVTPVNDAPVAVDDTNASDALVEQGFGVAGDDTAQGNVLSNDTDIDATDVLSVIAVDSGTGEAGSNMAVDPGFTQVVLGRYGALHISADGTWQYALNNADADTEALADGEKAYETFTYTVSDGHSGQDTATLTLEIAGSGDNVPPVANADDINLTEDKPATLDLLGNDTDGNNVPAVTQTLSVVSINGQAATVGATIATTHGSITIGAGGSVDYTPDANYNGADSFTYVATDGLENSAPATVTLDIAAVNDVPTITANGLTVDEDTPRTFTGLSISDVDAGSGAIAVWLAVEHGNLTFAGGTSGLTFLSGDGTNGIRYFSGSLADINTALASLQYTGDQNFNGQDTLSIHVDDKGNTGAGGALAERTTVDITVNPANDAPVLGTIALPGAVSEDTDASAQNIAPVVGTLPVTDVDIGGSLSASVYGSPTLVWSGGSLSLAQETALTSALVAGKLALGTGTANGSVTTLPYSWDPSAADLDFLAAGQTLEVTYQIGVSDGLATSPTQPLTFTITGTNDTPEATISDGTLIGFEGVVPSTGYADRVGAFLHDGFRWSISGTGHMQFVGGEYSGGAYSINGTSAIRTISSPPVISVTEENGDVFAVIKFNLKAISHTQTIVVTGTLAGNQIFQQVFSVTGGVPQTIIPPNLQIDSLTIQGQGELTIDNFIYSDGGPVFTENGSPVVVTDSIVLGDVDNTSLESATVAIAGGHQAAEDVLTFVDQNNIAGTFDAASGVLTLTGSATLAQYQAALRTVTYSNASDDPDTTSRTIGFSINDGGADSAVATATIKVDAANDAPVAVADGLSGTEDTVSNFTAAELLGNDTDVDNLQGDLAIASVTNGTGGTVVLNPNGTVSFTPIGNFNGAADFTYTITDGELESAPATATVNVAAANDAPTFGGTDTGVVNEDYGVSNGNLTRSGTLTISDPDAGESSYQADTLTSANGGQLVIDTAGNWTYTLSNTAPVLATLNDDQSFIDTFSVKSADGTTKNVEITVNGNNELALWDFSDWDNATSQAVSFTSYAGLNWSATDAAFPGFAPAVGGYYGLALNRGLSQTVIVTAPAGGSFDYYGAWVRNGGPSGQEATSLHYAGFKNGSPTGSFDVAMSANNDWIWTGSTGSLSGIDELRITATGNYSGNGVSNTGYWYMDNLYIRQHFSHDPLVLDLNGDGLHFTAASFDLNHDGIPDSIGWPAGGDGLLVADLDGSGAIENGSEVFSPGFDGGAFTNSLEALKSFDSNGDGKITAEDTTFETIKVWVDANADGVSDAGELNALGDLGIVEIDLGANDVDLGIDGQHVFAQGSFTLADGTVHDYFGVDLSAADSSAPTLIGTDGADHFVLDQIDVTEVIADYDEAQGDTIDLTALLANVAPAEKADAVRYVDDHLQVDTDGAGTDHDFVTVADIANHVPALTVIIDDGTQVSVSQV